MRARTLRPPLPSRPSWWLEEARAHGGHEVSPPLAEATRRRRRDRRRWLHRALDGARAARARPVTAVALLEAREIGDGPSGRNGGFLHGYWSSLADAPARARRRCRTAARARLGQDRAGGAGVLREPRRGRLAARGRAAEGLGRRVRGRRRSSTRSRPRRELGVEEEALLLDAPRSRRRCDSPRFRSGVFFRDGATVQPARLVLGAPARGDRERGRSCSSTRRSRRRRGPASARDAARRRPRARGRARA